ncbi:T9SS type A sorting domain-containing protein [Flavobacteriaceae bacterium 14752]|uniref:T9SS type A sorting domain-containing protein n=1 Tax=Mesohalobacter salilacus TaxID=2491711 RepID=UPI000F63966C|nr:T9SS C-terminal target domain-containing protein [Flavobacteriaceae bacterium 14752]
MKKIYLFLLGLFSLTTFSQNVTITKIIETGCSSPFVKTVELYVDGTVDFATEVTINYMQNGAPWADNQIDVSALGVQTDSFVYLIRDIPLMQAEFPSTTFDASNTVVVGTSTNGDDGYQVVLNGTVVSQFGKTETDADNDTSSNWQHSDAVATRLDGIPDLGTWDPTHWDITPEQDLDDHTACQGGVVSPNLETYFASLGATFPLGTGSGWTPTGNVCTTIFGNTTSVSCMSEAVGSTDDTYTASIDFSNANDGNTFTVSTTAGTVGGDDPNIMDSGTIQIMNIPEGTDVTVTLSDLGDGGVCDLSVDIDSPACVPLVLNEALFDPPSDDGATPEVEGDANNDGTRDALDDEFLEFFNNSNSSLDISGYKIYDSNALGSGTPRHIVPANTVIPANGAYVVFGGGTPTGNFGTAIVQTASDGQLNLSNSGDVVTVTTGTDDFVLELNSPQLESDLGIDFGSNESITRNPDITGGYDFHTNANPVLVFSPGLRVDGTTLSTEDVNLNNEFKIYPNPVTNGFVTIDSNISGETNIELYDLTGKIVMNKTLTTERLEVSNLRSGVYLVKISVSNRSITKKLIIK